MGYCQILRGKKQMTLITLPQIYLMLLLVRPFCLSQKVTLARRGILRPNDRLLAPFVLLSKQTLPPITSLNRLAAFNLGLPLPNPMEDPDGWMGRRVRQHIKINSHHLSRNQRSAWYEG